MIFLRAMPEQQPVDVHKHEMIVHANNKAYHTGNFSQAPWYAYDEETVLIKLLAM